MKACLPWLIVAGLLLPPMSLEAQSPRAGADAQSSRGVTVSGERSVPDTHRVEGGDTLWDITAHYFGNPYDWPKVWSYNPEITNPHWIYPGDSVALRSRGGGAAEARLPTLASGAQVRTRTAPESVWLRQEAFLDKETFDSSGVIAGSPEEQMLLSNYDRVYVSFDEGAEPAVGDELTVFRRLEVEDHEPDKDGELVRILGTVRIEGFDPDTKVGRGLIVETLEPIERGFRVAPVQRELTMVPPRANASDLEAKVIASLRPVELIGSDQVAFLDAGAEQGVAVGNRFFLLRAGDAYRDTNEFRRATGEPVDQVEELDEYPEEIVAEGRVVHVRSGTSTILIHAATTEIRIGERAVMRSGF